MPSTEHRNWRKKVAAVRTAFQAVLVLLLATGGLWAVAEEMGRDGWGLPAVVTLDDAEIPISWDVGNRAPSCLADVTARRPNAEWAVCKELCGSLPVGAMDDVPPAGAELVTLQDGADLRCADLTNVTFAVGLLDDLDLRCARLNKVTFTAAGSDAPHLTGIKLGGASISQSNFGGATISHADLSCASFDGGTFDETTLDSTILWATRVRGTALLGAKIKGSVISHMIFNADGLPQSWSPMYPQEFRTLMPAGVVVAEEDGSIRLVGGAPAWESAIAPLAQLAKSFAEGGARQSASALNHRIEAFWLLWHLPTDAPDGITNAPGWFGDWMVWGFNYAVAMISDNRSSYRRPLILLFGLWAVASVVFLFWLTFEHYFRDGHHRQLRTGTNGDEAVKIDTAWDAISVAGAFGFKATVLRWMPTIWPARARPEFIDAVMGRIGLYDTRGYAQVVRLAFDAAGVVVFVGLLALLSGDALGLLDKILDR